MTTAADTEETPERWTEHISHRQMMDDTRRFPHTRFANASTLLHYQRFNFGPTPRMEKRLIILRRRLFGYRLKFWLFQLHLLRKQITTYFFGRAFLVGAPGHCLPALSCRLGLLEGFRECSCSAKAPD